MSKVIGYVLDSNGYYQEKYYFNYSAENIAIFIIQNKNNEVIVTDIADQLICKSLPGGFLNTCSDPIFLRTELLPILVDLQNGMRYKRLEFYESEKHVMLQR